MSFGPRLRLKLGRSRDDDDWDEVVPDPWHHHPLLVALFTVVATGIGEVLVSAGLKRLDPEEEPEDEPRKAKRKRKRA